jgi:hypothetical protein
MQNIGSEVDFFIPDSIKQKSRSSERLLFADVISALPVLCQRRFRIASGTSLICLS